MDPFNRLETPRLVLRKARDEDLDFIWRNVWQDETLAETMLWQPTHTREDAVLRMEKTRALQAEHFAYFVCLKETDEPIGMAGITEAGPGTYDETGICIARRYQGQGCGKELLQALIALAFDRLDGHTFLYSCFRENIPSASLCKSLGFQYTHSDTGVRSWDGYAYTCDHFVLHR